MEAKKAILAMSGDPITYGHINIIERALTNFSHITVAIGINRKKKYIFDLEERVKMTKIALSHLDPSRIEVLPFEGLLVDFAYSKCANTIVRGVRNSVIDYESEALLNQVNQSLRRGIDTYVLFSDPKLSHVSSSVVKDLTLNYANDLLDYVPMYVKMQLEKKLLKQCRIGVTGEIGAGKSYVTKWLLDIIKDHCLTAHEIDMDAIGRYILTESKDPIAVETRGKVNSLLGGMGIYRNDSMIDLKIMGSLLWWNNEKLSDFNKIMYEPMLFEYSKRLANKEGIILVNSALFAEADMMGFCNNNVIVVSADDEIRKSRLTRRGYSEKEMKDRMSAQYSSHKKIEIIQKSIEKHKCGTIFNYNNAEEGDPTPIKEFFKETLEPFIVSYFQ